MNQEKSYLHLRSFRFGHLLLLLICFASCHLSKGQDSGYIMTVNGKLPVEAMGKTLVHEHIVTNFEGTRTPNQRFDDPEEAIGIILPRLKYLKTLGYSTLFECTPSFIGKNVELLQKLSKLSGINIVTNTGYYAAVDKKYLPENIREMTIPSMVAVWDDEWKKGISDTGSRPGFIKLGVGKGALDSIEQKIFKAGMMLSNTSGMAVAVHTGDGTSIKSQYHLARANNFDLNKLIWVHAQNGKDEERIEMAKKGIWISLDGVSETRIEEYLRMISVLRDESLLSRLLVSHDDGWAVGVNNGVPILELFGNGNKAPYRTISQILVARLYQLGFSKKQIDTLLVENPKIAYGIRN